MSNYRPYDYTEQGSAAQLEKRFSANFALIDTCFISPSEALSWPYDQAFRDHIEGLIELRGSRIVQICLVGGTLIDAWTNESWTSGLPSDDGAC